MPGVPANNLICQNAKCRFLLDLREAGPAIRRSSLVVNGCPECGQPWSSRCPYCSQQLDVLWMDNRAHCAACNKPLRVAESRLESVRSNDGDDECGCDNNQPTANEVEV